MPTRRATSRRDTAATPCSRATSQAAWMISARVAACRSARLSRIGSPNMIRTIAVAEPAVKSPLYASGVADDDVRVEHVARLSQQQIAAVRAVVDAAAEADGVNPLSEHVLLHLRYGGDEPARNVLAWHGD